MKVILLKDVRGVGKQHEVVEVKDGYAKNFLIKNRIAVASTNLANELRQKDLLQEAKAEASKMNGAEILKKQLEKIELIFTLKTFDNNAFGSISHKQIIDELKNKHSIKIDKYMFVNHNEKSLSLGKHEVTVRLYKSIVAKLIILVKGEERV